MFLQIGTFMIEKQYDINSDIDEEDASSGEVI